MMKLIITLFFILLPICVHSQSEVEIRTALKVCDYEKPIQLIGVAIGDTILTPLRAQALEAMNRHSEAIKEWNSLLKEDSTHISILMELAKCYKATNRNHQAARCYQKAASLSPDNRYFRQQHIRSLLSIEEYAKACNECQVWIEQDSTSATAYQLLGMAYEGISIEYPDSLDDAYMTYQGAYRLDSLNGQTVARLAAILNDFEQYQDAVEITENYRLIDTTDIQINRQNAKAYCMLKEYDKSIERHEALKEMKDKNFTTYYYLGISYIGKKDYWQAHDNLLLAHNKRPFDINTLYHLAKASVNGSWREDGLEYIKRAIEIVTPTDSLMTRLYEGLVECSRIVPKDPPYDRIKDLKKLHSLNKDYKLFYNIAYIYDKETKDEANALYYYKKYMDAVTKNGKLLVDSNGNPINDAYTAESIKQKRIIDFFKKMNEKTFFEKGVPKNK